MCKLPESVIGNRVAQGLGEGAVKDLFVCHGNGSCPARFHSTCGALSVGIKGKCTYFTAQTGIPSAGVAV